MIRIIKGVFGYNNGKSVIPKTEQDGPFECDKAIEKRLVSLGVAEYVTDIVEATETVEATGTIEIINEPTREALIAKFKELKLKGNPNTMKDETLKAKIAEATEPVEDEESNSSDDNAPSFDEVDGVEG
jgi:hypothetical protein